MFSIAHDQLCIDDQVETVNNSNYDCNEDAYSFTSNEEDVDDGKTHSDTEKGPEKSFIFDDLPQHFEQLSEQSVLL